MLTGTMSPEVATIALAIGLMFAFVCYLTTNLSPGGMITPGWIAVTVTEDPRKLVVIAAVTALTYGSTLVLQRAVILYGKRLFAAVIMVSVLFSTGLFLLVHNDFPVLFVHQTLGFIIPGLIAYQLVRQPRRATIACTTAVSLAAYGVLASGILLDLIPTA
jgi:gamma-polyglutamate biosynthesis protein CapC